MAPSSAATSRGAAPGTARTSKTMPFQVWTGKRRRSRQGSSAKWGAPISWPPRSYVQRCSGQTMFDPVLPRPPQHHRLAMAADVGHQAEPRRRVQETRPSFLRAAGRSSRRPPARRANGRRSAGCARTGGRPSALVEPRVEVAADGKGRLGRGRALPGVTRRSDMAGRASWVALAQRGPGVDGSAAGKAEGPRIVPSPRAQPVCSRAGNGARARHRDRAFGGSCGAGAADYNRRFSAD
jgi:hypothetical protein